MGIYKFDIVILGGGPAGLSAGIYAARSNASTAIIDISMLGGQPSNYLELENYPGFPIIGGYDLMEKFEEHADKFGVKKFPMQEIKNINLVSYPKIIKYHITAIDAVKLAPMAVIIFTYAYSFSLSALLPFFFPFFLLFSTACGVSVPSAISRFASAISAFISTINTFSFSSHSSLVWA